MTQWPIGCRPFREFIASVVLGMSCFSEARRPILSDSAGGTTCFFFKNRNIFVKIRSLFFLPLGILLRKKQKIKYCKKQPPYICILRVLPDQIYFLFSTRCAACTIPFFFNGTKVSAVRHGASGFSKTPRGLLLENFLTHADPSSAELNGPPKVTLPLPLRVVGSCCCCCSASW